MCGKFPLKIVEYKLSFHNQKGVIIWKGKLQTNGMKEGMVGVRALATSTGNLCGRGSSNQKVYIKDNY